MEAGWIELVMVVMGQLMEKVDKKSGMGKSHKVMRARLGRSREIEGVAG